MSLTLTREERQAHLKSMQLLLRAEATILADIRDVVTRTVPSETVSAEQAARAYAALRSRLADALLIGRERARVASHTGVGYEWAVARSRAVGAGVDPRLLPDTMPRVGRASDDQALANLAAVEVADEYLKRAQEAILAGSGVSRRSAVPKHVMGRVAATQGATAFADERQRIEREAARRYAGTSWFPALLKLWQATLDPKACNVCAHMHNQIRPWGVDYEQKRVPSKVHRKCRCISANVFSPLYLGSKRAK